MELWLSALFHAEYDRGSGLYRKPQRGAADLCHTAQWHSRTVSEHQGHARPAADHRAHSDQPESVRRTGDFSEWDYGYGGAVARKVSAIPRGYGKRRHGHHRVEPHRREFLLPEP